MISDTRCPRCGSSQIAASPAGSGRAEFPVLLICYGAIIAGGDSAIDGLLSSCIMCGCHWKSDSDVGAPEESI